MMRRRFWKDRQRRPTIGYTYDRCLTRGSVPDGDVQRLCARLAGTVLEHGTERDFSICYNASRQRTRQFHLKCHVNPQVFRRLYPEDQHDEALPTRHAQDCYLRYLLRLPDGGADPATDPAADPATDPAADPATDPVISRAGEPATDPEVGPFVLFPATWEDMDRAHEDASRWVSDNCGPGCWHSVCTFMKDSVWRVGARVDERRFAARFAADDREAFLARWTYAEPDRAYR